MLPNLATIEERRDPFSRRRAPWLLHQLLNDGHGTTGPIFSTPGSGTVVVMRRSSALAYTAAWSLLCVAAAVTAVRHRRDLAIFRKTYWRSLSSPWKLVTFALAMGFFLLVAPYTGDPTWDWIDATFMGSLTYTTAPWSVGALYLAMRRKVRWAHAFIAACAWLFSASWSYDLYIFLRDGFFPASWLGNLIASSVLYVSAGLMWNLAYVPGRGVVFGFMDPAWPALPTDGRVGRVVAFALVFVALVATMMGWFFLDYLR
jgi:hypothetical protein